MAILYCSANILHKNVSKASLNRNKSMAQFRLGDYVQTACNLNVIIYMGDNYGKQY